MRTLFSVWLHLILLPDIDYLHLGNWINVIITIGIVTMVTEKTMIKQQITK
jgi:hypothetical protein